MYTRKTTDEVLKELEELQYESLFCQFATELSVNDVHFTRTELWLLAKDMVKDLYTRSNRDVFVQEYALLYKREFSEYLSFIPDDKKRKEVIDSLCYKVFNYAAIMVYHSMTFDDEIDKELTYKKSAIRTFDYGIVDGKRFCNSYGLDNLYESICDAFNPLFEDMDYYRVFDEDYNAFKKNGKIVFDYNYCTGERLLEPVTKAVNNVRLPLPKKPNEIFIDEDTASKAYLFIKDNILQIQNAYDWSAFYMFFDEKCLFKSRTSVKKFCEQMNHAEWFGDEIDKKCKEATLKNFSSLFQLSEYNQTDIDDLVENTSKKEITKAATDSIMHLFRKLKTNWNY